MGAGLAGTPEAVRHAGIAPPSGVMPVGRAYRRRDCRSGGCGRMDGSDGDRPCSSGLRLARTGGYSQTRMQGSGADYAHGRFLPGRDNRKPVALHPQSATPIIRLRNMRGALQAQMRNFNAIVGGVQRETKNRSHRANYSLKYAFAHSLLHPSTATIRRANPLVREIVARMMPWKENCQVSTQIRNGFLRHTTCQRKPLNRRSAFR